MVDVVERVVGGVPQLVLDAFRLGPQAPDLSGDVFDFGRQDQAYLQRHRFSACGEILHEGDGLPDVLPGPSQCLAVAVRTIDDARRAAICSGDADRLLGLAAKR